MHFFRFLALYGLVPVSQIEWALLDSISTQKTTAAAGSGSFYGPNFGLFSDFEWPLVASIVAIGLKNNLKKNLKEILVYKKILKKLYSTQKVLKLPSS